MNPKITSDLEKKIKNLEKLASGVGTVLPQMLSLLLSGPGTAVGIVATAISSYAQKRFEDNVSIMIEELKNRVDNLEKKLKNYSPDEIKLLTHKIFPLVWDYSADEVQTEKVKMIVNGFEYIVEQKLLDQERVLELYDTLKTLRVNDIKTFISIEEGKCYEKMSNRIVNRIANLGIVDIKVTMDRIGNNSDYDIDEVEVSDFGIQFYYFIKREYDMT